MKDRAGGVHRRVSGSGKSSLAFGTLYAEAQRRYLESVAPYARRLFHQMGIPDVDEVDGIPPAVALQQQRGTPMPNQSNWCASALQEKEVGMARLAFGMNQSLDPLGK
jgi:excinuclease UvrABC ATPase subunit